MKTQLSARSKIALKLMTHFVDQSHRYLWTDAFAVSTLFGLAHATEDRTYHQFALKLIDEVHNVLGRFASNDDRKGWISGLSDVAAAHHPTAGGLRIGKSLPERKASEAFDERLEWERDGQYFHYLTQWVYTLLRAWEETGEDKFALWAAELTQVAIQHFVVHDKGPPKMYWKMSIDLTRPLVPLMGAHDPLEGFICVKLCEPIISQGDMNFKKYLRDMTELCRGRDWRTSDPLGIGGLLLSAARVAKLPEKSKLPEEIQLEKLLLDINESLEQYSKAPDLSYAAEHRLAFRECGLSLGLHSLASIEKNTENPKCLRILKNLKSFIPLADNIEDFWCRPENQQSSTWTEHIDINTVMLASSLRPDGILGV